MGNPAEEGISEAPAPGYPPPPLPMTGQEKNPDNPFNQPYPSYDTTYQQSNFNNIPPPPDYSATNPAYSPDFPQPAAVPTAPVTPYPAPGPVTSYSPSDSVTVYPARPVQVVPAFQQDVPTPKRHWIVFVLVFGLPFCMIILFTVLGVCVFS